ADGRGGRRRRVGYLFPGGSRHAAALPAPAGRDRRGGAARRRRRGRILAGRRGTGPGPERDLARAGSWSDCARRSHQGDSPRRPHRGSRTGARPLTFLPREGGATRRKPMIQAVVIAVLVLLFLYSAVRVLREYERGVIFTLGRYTGTKGPGLFLLVP